MPSIRGTDGSVEDLPTYILRAFGHDRSWMRQGDCHPTRRATGVTAHTWTLSAGIDRTIDGRHYIGEDCETRALEVCHDCPVQWSCTHWAIEVDERTGTWGVRYDDLAWLKKQRDATMIIDAAAAQHMPVQVAVGIVRAHRV